MPLDTRTDALAAAVRNKINLLVPQIKTKQPRILPSWVPSTSPNPMSASGVYNLKAANTTRLRSGLSKALGGTDNCHLLAVGDSALVGYSGTTNVIEKMMITRGMADALANAYELPLAGTGFQPINGASGYPSDRLSTTGTVSFAGTTPVPYMVAGSSMTYTAEVWGDGFNFYYTGLSTNFTYQVDGGAAIGVTSPGTSTYEKVPITGLTRGLHTLRINAPTNYVFPMGFEVTDSTHKGIAAHSIAWGGSTANWGSGNSWLDPATNSTGSVRMGAWASTGYTPHLVLISLGGNDMYQSGGDTAQHAIDGIQSVRNLFPNSDAAFLASGFPITGTDPTKWAEYTALKYALADTLNIPIFDTGLRSGGSLAAAQALGLTGPDNLHQSPGAQREHGMWIGRELAAA